MVELIWELDSVTLCELYAVSDAHLDGFSGHRVDSPLIESPTRLNGFSLNTGVAERLECDDTPISPEQ